MAKIVKHNIPCPSCKAFSEQEIYYTVNEELNGIASKILNNEINFVKCNNCSNKFQIKTGLLYCNHQKQFAVYFHPNNIHEIDNEIMELKKMHGELHFLNKIIKFSDWDKFKEKIFELEDPSKLTVRTVRNRSDFMPYHDNFWTCDICDGDSTSGCLYFDPTECPRHT